MWRTCAAALLVGGVTVAGGWGPETLGRPPAGAPVVSMVVKAGESAPDLRVSVADGGQSIQLVPVVPDKTPYLIRSAGAVDGKAALVVVVLVDGKLVAYDYTLAVSVGPIPTPPVPPNPIPPTPTPPVGKYTFAVIVEETGERTPAQSVVIDSAAVRQEVAKHGHPLQVVDRDVPGSFAAYVEHAGKAAKLPYLILVADDGTVIWEGPLPATEAATLELLKAR